ncbi:MAG: Asp-tRNA(Asn)/Glu-tRNA(Gln) amidotransferase subunit GatA [Candidatus Liptonbacteria bacterium]|nr:Asp-tRNA(Asn)/Glu-tRNA(Gln) amidotransferase subunit GatA [Candidatus Liptonbacteria bacterium]
MSLEHLTIADIRACLAKKEFSAFELAERHLDAIRARDADIGAYLSVDERGALEQAKDADIAIAKGEALPPLAGVPLAIKDNILIKGGPATAGSKILADYRAPYDATVMEKLRRMKAVFLGKTNLDEFAMGASTEHSAFKVTKNPRDLSRVPGGSSGGSAAAVAADLAAAALGSDTGGSIRQPAAFCGVVGLKPTYGSVSRSGLIALASSLDQIGPITKTVADARILFDAIKGPDANDQTSESASADPTKTLSFKEVKGLTIGIPKEYFGEGIDPAVRAAVEAYKTDLGSMGISFKEISLPHTPYAISAYYIILPAEASTNLARYDNIRYAAKRPAGADLLETYIRNRTEGFGDEVKRRILLGNFVLSAGHYDAYYKKAQAVRERIRRDLTEAFKTVDVILTPVAPTNAFKIGEKTDDPLAMYLADIFTVSVNLAGLPAISVPVRTVKGPLPAGRQGLPTNVQLIGNAFREDILLSLGETYERLHSGN